MHKPAVWNADPECGHQVAHAHQTHYCTYIRAPRLLTLQASNDLLAIAFQWYELWFKVLLTDLNAALREDGSTFEPVKLLRRGVALYRLFSTHADLCETLTRELAPRVFLRDATTRGISRQFAEILDRTRQLARRWRGAHFQLADALREYRAHQGAFRARFYKFTRSTLVHKLQAPTYAHWLHLKELLALQDGARGVDGRRTTAHRVDETERDKRGRDHVHHRPPML